LVNGSSISSSADAILSRGALLEFAVARTLSAAWVAMLVLKLAAEPVLADADAALNKELTDLLAAQKLACGKIVSVDTQSDRDYLVACQNGNTYEINSDAQGKLVVHPLGHKIHSLS
jgi:aminoglycoside phosphotransferase